MDQKLEMLARCPFLAGLSKKDLQQVGRLADEIDVPAGKVLAKEGSRGEEFFVIIEGAVRISRDGVTLRDLAPGEFFGELALLGKVPRTATATASTPTRLFVIGHREFTSLLSSQPSVRDVILTAVASRIASIAQSASN
jgi:CRP-like cAMP-binding protein